MSETTNPATTPKGEHGTLHSYVVGFVLSVILTLVPYFLVVNHVLDGTRLLVTILGIAVLQMIVQIVFFLHLGRGPKPFYNVVFFFATAGLIVIVIGASLLIMDNLYRNMSPEELVLKQAQEEGIAQISGRQTGACQGNKDSHVVKIKDGIVTPGYVNADRCDTLTFVNEDSEERKVAFGLPPAKESYGGEHEILLQPDEPETITLNQPGDFIFYDDLNPMLTGGFSVSE